MTDLVVNPYGGPGGWDEGAAHLGLRPVGIEHDAAACATRAAAGHLTIRADVAAMPLEHLAGQVNGAILSPPCQAFSTAGTGAGRAVIDQLAAAIRAGDWTGPTHDDERVRHVLEVGRWVETLRPRWVACEQVPPVLPLWVDYAERWRARGWSTWAGILNAADYGVPQTRRRAFLIARRDGRPAAPPPPTHCKGGSDTLFGELAPWVSMAAALGWTGEDTPARTVCGDRSPRWLYEDRDGTHGRQVGFPRTDDRGDSPDGYRERDWRDEDEPAFAVTEKARSWVVRTGANSMVTGRTHDDLQPYERDITDPAPTIDRKVGGAWRLIEPGGTRDRNNDNMVGRSENAIRLDVWQAGVLQSFPPDYPWQGTRTAQFRQAGDAVPPLLARRILEQLT